MNWTHHQPMNIQCYRTVYQPLPGSFVLAPSSANQFSDDHRLLPRRSRITNNIFERTISTPRSRSYSARPPISRRDRQSFQISYEIHDGFTPREERIIKNALQIVEDRLINPEILQNMYNICGTSGYHLEKGVWPRSQLENHRNYDGPHDLLRYQLMCLRVKGEKDEFPTIHIYPIYERSEMWGRGTIDCVSCISHGSTFSVEGEFKVKLNRYNLGAYDKNSSDPVSWGGLIAHEMLHNLGHGHNGDDYDSNWQINVFQRCFVYNGNYYP
jgi:hypothetical protein